MACPSCSCFLLIHAKVCSVCDDDDDDDNTVVCLHEIRKELILEGLDAHARPSPGDSHGRMRTIQELSRNGTVKMVDFGIEGGTLASRLLMDEKVLILRSALCRNLFLKRCGGRGA